MRYSKTVLITGASRGIGKTMATLFALNKYNVLINYNNSKDSAVRLTKKLNSLRLSTNLFKADISDRKQVDLMMQYCVDYFGGIDILINNAGISSSILFTNISCLEWNKTINTNLNGVFNCTQSALKYMLKQKSGKIINISSIWGLVGASCEVHYSTAKAGIIGFTKALAKELGPSNILVNCIAPGIINTDMLSTFSKQEIDDLRYNTPLMKIGRPKDVAYLALYLASNKANFITGQVISPNGGFVI